MTPTAYLLLCCATIFLGQADPRESVVAGREALDRSIWQYPWYDSETDGVRPIEVSEPWYEKWDWLWDWLEDLFSFDGSGSTSWLKWLIWFAIAALLAVLTYLLLRTFLGRERGQSGSAGDTAESDTADDRRRTEALPAPVRRRRSDLLAEAGRCYQEGNFSEAIIYLFSYQLVQLDKHQLVRLARGKTNRQYLRELGRPATLRRLFAHTMVVFEDAFFGSYAIDRDRFEAVWSRMAEFQELMTEGAA